MSEVARAPRDSNDDLPALAGLVYISAGAGHLARLLFAGQAALRVAAAAASAAGVTVVTVPAVIAVAVLVAGQVVDQGGSNRHSQGSICRPGDLAPLTKPRDFVYAKAGIRAES